MQRMAVDLPDPEGPQITIRSTLPTVSDTFLSAWNVPYHLLTLRISTIGALASSGSGFDRAFIGTSLARLAELALQHPRAVGEREAHAEIDDRNQPIGHDRLERGVGDVVAGLDQFAETDDRRDRGAFHQLHQEADRRRHGDPQGLRQDDVAHLHHELHAEAGAGVPLAASDGIDATTPDLAQEGAG